MIKEQLIQTHFQKKSLLTFDNEHYKKVVDDLLVWLFANDDVDHDKTTQLLFPQETKVKARIISKEQIVVAGIEEIEYLLQEFSDISYECLYNDGDKVEANQIILELTGDIQQVLSLERTILNILQRMSGIATQTNQLIKEIAGKSFIAATRKTPWGLLDKKAVSAGGGLTHRLDLADNILVKDNHLLYITPEVALDKMLQQTKDTMIEIEVENEETADKLIHVFSSQKTSNLLTILLDNFSTHKAKQFLTRVKHHPQILFEASGGISEKNISEWAKIGVDIISLGALTHSVKAADISLDLL